jgi:hypothetical protein
VNVAELIEQLQKMPTDTPVSTPEPFEPRLTFERKRLVQVCSELVSRRLVDAARTNHNDPPIHDALLTELLSLVPSVKYWQRAVSQRCLEHFEAGHESGLGDRERSAVDPGEIGGTDAASDDDEGTFGA